MLENVYIRDFITMIVLPILTIAIAFKVVHNNSNN